MAPVVEEPVDGRTGAAAKRRDDRIDADMVPVPDDDRTILIPPIKGINHPRKPSEPQATPTADGPSR